MNFLDIDGLKKVLGMIKDKFVTKSEFENVEVIKYDKVKQNFSFGRGSAPSQDSTATGTTSIGVNTKANGNVSFAEGGGTVANGNRSHAEGGQTIANGNVSHAEGSQTIANGNVSHAEGLGTITNNYCEHACGKHNNSTAHAGGVDAFNGNGNATLFSIGNGSNSGATHNAFEVKQDGTILIPDMGSNGEYYQKEMMNLQAVIKNLQDRIAELESK